MFGIGKRIESIACCMNDIVQLFRALNHNLHTATTVQSQIVELLGGACGASTRKEAEAPLMDDRPVIVGLPDTRPVIIGPITRPAGHPDMPFAKADPDGPVPERTAKLTCGTCGKVHTVNTDLLTREQMKHWYCDKCLGSKIRPPATELAKGGWLELRCVRCLNKYEVCVEGLTDAQINQYVCIKCQLDLSPEAVSEPEPSAEAHPLLVTGFDIEDANQLAAVPQLSEHTMVCCVCGDRETFAWRDMLPLPDKYVCQGCALAIVENEDLDVHASTPHEPATNDGGD